MFIGPVPEYKQDHVSLFGSMSLVSPPLRGSEAPEEEVWAEGLSAPEGRSYPDDGMELKFAARHRDALIAAGSYEHLLPEQSISLEGKPGAGQRSKVIADWAMALNPSISLGKGQEVEKVVSTYLK